MGDSKHASKERWRIQVIVGRMMFYSPVKCLLIYHPSRSFPASLSPCSVWKKKMSSIPCYVMQPLVPRLGTSLVFSLTLFGMLFSWFLYVKGFLSFILEKTSWTFLVLLWLWKKVKKEFFLSKFVWKDLIGYPREIHNQNIRWPLNLYVFGPKDPSGRDRFFFPVTF